MRCGQLGLVVTMALGLWAAGARRANACSCATPPPPADRLAAVAAVFEGYVLDAKPDGVQVTIHYQVLRAWKGVHADSVVTVMTASDGGACGVEVAAHTKYLVYATELDGRLNEALCFGSHPSDQDAGDFAALGAPDETGVAAPGSVSLPTPMTTSGGGCSIGYARDVGAPAILLVTACALATRRRRASRS